MEKLLVIDGNSIINRAFYGIMGNQMLMTTDGRYTNAVYGFLAILFRTLEEIKPDYIAIAFDLRAPTKRHLLYKEYKGTRKGMPDELAEQMPLLKEVLRAMNITIIEKEGYEADDILGTLATMASNANMEAVILSGDRDTFQLINKNINVLIPHTKAGKTETEIYNEDKIQEIYGLEPKKLIEIKGLMGDTSDNIPGIPGVGEKTALKLIKEFGSIEGIYEKVESGEQDIIKGALKEKVILNKEKAFLSKELGTIDVNAPIENKLEGLKIQEWDKQKVLEIFKELKFNRYIERFNLSEAEKDVQTEQLEAELIEGNEESKIKPIIEEIKQSKVIYYLLETSMSSNPDLIMNRVIDAISIYSEKNNKVYYIVVNNNLDFLKEIFEAEDIEKCSYEIKENIILLKQIGIEPQNMSFDVKIAAYILNSVTNQYSISTLAETYLNIEVDRYMSEESTEKKENQISLFEEKKIEINKQETVKTLMIYKLKKVLEEKLKENEGLELFQTIEMPLTPVLANMEYEGVYVDKNELIQFGQELQQKIQEITKEIYEIAGEEFNINSTKQLGEILFEKLKLTVHKKTKKGYSTDVEILEKLKDESPIIEKILEYRKVAKMNSTFVEGMLPFIKPKTNRIHTQFHQTVTATGRISSSDPNMQNIPTREELGKMLRKVFKAEKGRIFLDADYSQIELRVFAHISDDKEMIKAFGNDEDIHSQVASKVFGIDIEEVTPELRTKAKAVNFGIVYGISDFGLGERLGVPKAEAKRYIQQYLEKYSGIKKFMESIPDVVKEKGYVETAFKRRRYVPEIKSNNYVVRQFGIRAAMNMPIQGTAADIIKMAMINVYNELKKQNLKSKLILQVHDELLIETYEEEKEVVKNILKNCMENVINLSVPLKADINEGKNWYEAK